MISWVLGSLLVLSACGTEENVPEPDTEFTDAMWTDADVWTSPFPNGPISGRPNGADVSPFPDVETPDPLPTVGPCPRGASHWAQLSRFAPSNGQRHSWPIAEHTTLCGASWISILQRGIATRGAWDGLAREYIAARLNVADGSPVPAGIEGTIAQARDLLATCRSFVVPGTSGYERALELREILASYNNHEIPLGLCSGPQRHPRLGDYFLHPY